MWRLGIRGATFFTPKNRLLSGILGNKKFFSKKPDGLRERLLKSGSAKPLVDESCVSRAKVVPPANTRALLRGKVVEACDLAGRSASIGWSYVRLDDPPSPQIDLLNPLENESPEVSRLLAKIENLKRG